MMPLAANLFLFHPSAILIREIILYRQSTLKGVGQNS